MSNIDLSMCYRLGGVSAEERNTIIKDTLKKGLDDRLAKYKAKRDEIANLQYEEKLILRNICDCLSEDINLSYINLFCGFSHTLFTGAWRFFNHYKNEDKTKLKKKELKEYEEAETAFHYITDHINIVLLGDFAKDVELIEYLESPYEGGYDLTYKYKDIKFGLFIPDFSMTNEDNVFDIMSGYKLRYHESDFVINTIYNNLDFTKVAEETKKWLTAEGWKKYEEEH